jgi:N-acetylmuramic acid 6-phosphate etherase
VKKVRVLNDALSLLEGLSAGPGNHLLLAVGTGAVAFGLDTRKRVYRVDGWGPLAGDAGSGYWIGRKGLETALASYDGRKRNSQLTRSVLKSLGISKPENEISKIYQNPPTQAQIAGLTVAVVKASRAGDPEAKTLLNAASQALAESVKSLLHRMPKGQSQLIVTGGLTTKVPEVMAGIKQLVRNSKGRLRLHSGAVVPEAAGLFLAFEQTGNPLSDKLKSEIVNHLVRSTPKTSKLKTSVLPMSEASNPATERFSFLKPMEMVKLMNAEDSKVAPAIAKAMPAIAKAVAVIEKRLKKGGRLIYVGAGTSGRLGILDASEVPPTFGFPADRVLGIIAGGSKAITQAVEGAEDNAKDGAAQMRKIKVGSKDTVVGLSVSGSAPFVLGAIQEAKRRGAATVGITCNSGPALSKAVGISIELKVGPEVVTGSSRLKAGTAQKMVLNMLTTCSMARLGYVTGNLMNSVATTNQKLRLRAIRIAAKLLNISEPEAKARLEKTGWKIKRVLEKRNS